MKILDVDEFNKIVGKSLENCREEISDSFYRGAKLMIDKVNEMAEERVVSELKEINKPFIILMNTANPYDEYAIMMAEELSNKYNSTVIPINCLEMNLEDINNIFSKLLYEFTIERIDVNLPKWIRSLDFENEIKLKLKQEIIKQLLIILRIIQTRILQRN